MKKLFVIISRDPAENFINLRTFLAGLLSSLQRIHSFPWWKHPTPSEWPTLIKKKEEERKKFINPNVFPRIEAQAED